MTYRPLLRSRAAKRARIVAILGMHRSGTSWLAGALQESGLELGDVNTAAPNNDKGNREHNAIRTIHEGVLRENGGSWRRPPSPIRWSRTRREQLHEVIETMSATTAQWGFKDPRTLLVLDEWHKQAKNFVPIGIYRHPSEVVRSLRARHDDFTEDEALDLWKIYNERLIGEHQRRPFPVIRFDVEGERLEKALGSIRAYLGVGDPASADSFFDRSLVHTTDLPPIPERLVDVWRELERLTLALTA